MSKTSSSRERIRRQATQKPDKFLHDELLSIVCKYFCSGMPVAEIREKILEKLGISLNREEPYRLLSFAAQRRWLRYQAPLTYEIADKITEKYSWLKGVKVVRTGVSDDISFHVAETLLDYVCNLSQVRSANSEVHIGFAGGKALRRTARHFSEMLQRPRENLPKSIVFHAIVAGFNVTDPSTDPNGFFTYFAGDSALQVQTSFMGLPAPGIVKSSEMSKLRTIPYMREAFDCVKKIDIVVTSAGGHWQDGHSGFYSMLRKASPHTLEQLDKAGCIADMMWQPLGKNGPLMVNTEMRTVTLMELNDLPEFIKRGKAVLLLLGPCGDCGGPKGDVLRAILAKPKLITHLVVDSRSGREFLG